MAPCTLHNLNALDNFFIFFISETVCTSYLKAPRCFKGTFAWDFLPYRILRHGMIALQEVSNPGKVLITDEIQAVR